MQAPGAIGDRQQRAERGHGNTTGTPSDLTRASGPLMTVLPSAGSSAANPPPRRLSQS